MSEIARYNNRDLRLNKCLTAPDFNRRTVLTNSSWEFVHLWLKRQKKKEALFYWDQAKEFFDAAKGLSNYTSPLLYYYAYMNAAKALLSSKGVVFSPRHGVGEDNSITRKKYDINNIGIKIHNSGVVHALSQHLSESEVTKKHTLKELFFNLPYVHRTYCLSYGNQGDMFIPLVDCYYYFDANNSSIYLGGKISKDFIGKKYESRLPSSIQIDTSDSSGEKFRSVASTSVSGRNLIKNDLSGLATLNTDLRRDIQYIAGASTLWYAKGAPGRGGSINRTPLVLALGAMHRLSELTRYHPLQLEAILDGDRNWLISEFLQMSPPQFIDQISSEITGFQFLPPSIRSAT